MQLLIKALTQFGQAMGRSITLGLMAVVALTMLAGMSQLTAQGSETGASAADAIVEAVRKAGGTVVVIQPDGAATADTDAPAQPSAFRQLQSDLLAARARFGTVVAEAPMFWSRTVQTLKSARPDPQQPWLPWALFSAAVASFAGWLAEGAYARWARKHFSTRYNPNPQIRAEKLGYLLMRLLIQGGGLALFVAVALFVGIILDGGHQAYRVTVLTIIAAAATYRLVSYGAAVVLARDASSHRMVPLTDAESAGLTSTVRRVATVSLSAAALCYWIANLGHSHSAHQLLLIVSTFICAVLLVVGTYRHRAAIGKIILGGETSEGQPALRRVIASAWFMPVAVYFIVAWGIGAVNVLLDRPLAFWLVVGPIGIAIMTLLAYWLMVYVIDRVFPDPAHLHGVAGVAAGNGEALAATAQPPTETRVDAPLETGSEATEEQPEDPAPMVLVRSPMHLLFERGAVVLAGILAVFLLGDLWGVGLTEEGMGAAFRDIGIICFLGYLAFDAVRIAINHRMALEEPADAAGDGDAEFGQGATRLATLLPLVRNAVLITISVIVMMVVLSKLGVDIGPLLAGAGVIGIAVGFGAQTLVRDVISGMFFLLDDAFRRGEYIDVGTVKGTVERISIRSMQLRHHRGALHTVPFGEVSRLTNHSRDWAIMKLPIRVTYDTDVEQLRKWIKKMGQDLLQHPEHGPKFIDPVKSQGVVQMEDSAMILRVKFKSKPQDQFVLRKVIYAKIQDLFEEHDIPFAHREVLVRVASDDDESSPKLGDKQKAQVAGAAAQAVSEPAVPATTGDAR